MGDLIDLDEYRKSKQKSPRQERYEEIMLIIDDFLEANPIEIKPFFISLEELGDMMMNKTPIVVDMPPLLYTDANDQKWAISGQNWIEVPDDTTFEDLDRYMVVRQRSDTSPVAEVRTYDVEGSKGNTYTVTDHGGTWTCTCAGFGWRRKCRHIREVRDELQDR
tara:strand:- start:174 stop:665 length:492 start_codon:yes stop_codon:yes gene_type:complete